ncbi:MAG: metal ABC transporter permease [Pseudanabaenaceae cyanobacterium SKYGB_i_bin29]|nr:metal ABC transporter permease [Pseudanabaenaceae cyanobacterium SKYG29]MDW8421880.1 metal ABC transporter permease [Pseudanabaenaceae cyanobacterium SKYGB_i_bin29]
MWEMLVAPWQYEFMVRAILLSSLVGLVCGALSCYMILKGWALMGDAVSHAVLPGVVLAYVLHLPLALGAFIFGVGSVLTIGFIQSQTRIKEDTVIGIVFTGFFALGLVLVSRVSSTIDLTHILFGNVLGISNTDIWQTVIIGIVTLVILLLLRRDLLLFCFDPTHARSIGINIDALHYVLLSLLSLTAVAGLQTVGIILVVAMLITPGATAYLLTDRFDTMLGLAMVIGVGGAILGNYVSFYLDVATGGCIVVVQTLVFIVAMFFAPKHGILGRKFWDRI